MSPNHSQNSTGNVFSRFAVIFRKHGLKPGDIVHTVVGNENMVFPMTFGVWTVGGAMSNGDVNLEDRSIALQVGPVWSKALKFLEFHLPQLKDTQAKIVICLDATADLVKSAIALSGRKSEIKLFSLGECEGCQNILEIVEETDVKRCS